MNLLGSKSPNPELAQTMKDKLKRPTCFIYQLEMPGSQDQKNLTKERIGLAQAELMS